MATYAVYGQEQIRVCVAGVVNVFVDEGNHLWLMDSDNKTVACFRQEYWLWFREETHNDMMAELNRMALRQASTNG